MERNRGPKSAKRVGLVSQMNGTEGICNEVLPFKRKFCACTNVGNPIKLVHSRNRQESFRIGVIYAYDETSSKDPLFLTIYSLGNVLLS